MDYKLKEYRQGLPDEVLLEDLRAASERVGGMYLSYEKYRSYSLKQFSEKTYTRRFGSWINALVKAGLKSDRNRDDAKRIQDSEIIKDIVKVFEAVKGETLTSVQFKEMGSCSLNTVIERFGSWSKALKAAGIGGTGHIGKIVDEDLYSEIERVWVLLGRQPTTIDMRRPGLSKFSLDTFMRRFGGWRGALRSFLQYVESPIVEEDVKSNVDVSCDVENSDVDGVGYRPSIRKKKTPRNINLRLRFTVLQRDGFSCRACGKSPAKDKGIELHVDHIVPWSLDGETVVDNLQALCSSCNFGKGNMT